MSDAGAGAAQRYREHMRDKAARLGGGEDAVSVDASSFTPGEPLNADAKTGMRPVSRQARKRGGGVHVGVMDPGPHALAPLGRKARKAGGSVGIDYVNRNAKAANEERAGRKHDGGMKKGGRAKRAVGGAGGAPAITLGGTPRPTRKMGFAGAASGRGSLGRHSTDTLHALAEQETNPSRLGHIFDEIDRRSGRKRGGRVGRAGGGLSALGALGGILPMAISQLGNGDDSQNKPAPYSPGTGRAAGGRVGRAEGGGVYKPDIEREGASFTRDLKRKTASSAVETRMGRASGGRVGRQDGGPLSTPLAAGMGGQGRMNFNFAPGRSTALRDGGRAKAHERYGASPGPAEHHPGMAKAAGGRAGRAYGGAAPGPAEDEGAVGQPSFKHRAPRGENSIRARTLASAEGRKDGGKVASGALKQHAEEHKAMGAHPKGCTCAKCSGGEVKARARGGKAGKGKMSVNIVIAPSGGAGAGAAGPPGMNPQLAIKPPAPPMPMPMPPGGAPGGAPMPMPMPMAGPAGPPGPPGMPPPGMPPRARGGRAPKGPTAGGEPMAGAGSGLGRLQKVAAYGHRSREGAGMRR